MRRNWKHALGKTSSNTALQIMRMLAAGNDLMPKANYREINQEAIANRDD